MSGITPPPIFIEPRRPGHSRQAEQRFYESCDHGLAIGLERALAEIAMVLGRLRRGPAAIDKARSGAFKIALRSTEPAPHDCADPRCRC